MIVATYLMGAHVYKSKPLASGAQLSGSGMLHPRKEEKMGRSATSSTIDCIITETPAQRILSAWCRLRLWNCSQMKKPRSIGLASLTYGQHQPGWYNSPSSISYKMSAHLPTDAVWLHQSEHKFAGHGCKSFCGGTCISDPFSWSQDPRTSRLSSPVYLRISPRPASEPRTATSSNLVTNWNEALMFLLRHCRLNLGLSDLGKNSSYVELECIRILAEAPRPDLMCICVLGFSQDFCEMNLGYTTARVLNQTLSKTPIYVNPECTKPPKIKLWI